MTHMVTMLEAVSLLCIPGDRDNEASLWESSFDALVPKRIASQIR